jgi:hypothetical protein
MAFKGTLKEFKVPDILQLFSLQSKTGILTFTSSDGFITLIFEDGKIVGVDAFPKKLGMRVGNVLVKQDLISDEMLQRALAIQKRTNQKIGEILTGMGLVGEEQIQEALENQAVQIVLSLFKWKKGEYNFKVLDYIDDSLRSIKPMPTDNLIMEGVQMLDEWPLIKERIPSDMLFFEPLPIESKDIEIIEEDKDESPRNDKIYLSETEANILKYVNGKNSVRDLVELGIFTEYKLYKSLYNLLKKNIIERKEKVEVEAKIDEKALEEIILKTNRRMNLMASLLLIILVILFVVNFFRPLHPIKKGNLILKEDLFHAVIADIKNN